jgi:AAA domain
VSATRRFEAVPFETIRRERTEWLLPGRIPIGGVTILGGDPGLGKSQWTCLLAAQLSRGELGPPAATLMLTAEDDPSRTIKPRLEAAGADLSLIHVVRGMSSDGFELPDDVLELERLVADVKARLVTIDPVSAHLCGKTDSFKDADVRRALRPLSDVGERHQCALLPVMHLNKGSGMPAIYRLSGSVAFSGAPRSILFFARDPDDPEGATGPQRALSHDKCNLGPECSTLLYEIEPVLIPARGDEPEVSVSRLKLIGESNRRGNDLLAFSDGDERTALEEAMEFLCAELANGPIERTEIMKRARAEGHAEKTLRRAREALGVAVDRAGFPSKSYWSLSRAHGAWAPLQAGVDGHDWQNPHGSNGFGAKSGPEMSSRAHLPGMGTTGELTDADGVSFDNDEVPGEQAIARLVEHNLEAKERTS